MLLGHMKYTPADETTRSALSMTSPTAAVAVAHHVCRSTCCHADDNPIVVRTAADSKMHNIPPWTLKQWIPVRWITRHSIHLQDGINKGNSSMKRFCRSELFFVRYGQLFEHVVDYLNRQGSTKQRTFRILRRLFCDHTTLILLVSWCYGTSTPSILVDIRGGAEKRENNLQVRSTFDFFSVHFEPICDQKMLTFLDVQKFFDRKSFCTTFFGNWETKFIMVVCSSGQCEMWTVEQQTE